MREILIKDAEVNKWQEDKCLLLANPCYTCLLNQSPFACAGHPVHSDCLTKREESKILALQQQQREGRGAGGEGGLFSCHEELKSKPLNLLQTCGA